MKKKTFCLKTLRLAFLFMLITASVEAVEYYVVIGAFADESNARKYVSEVRNTFKDVSYSYNPACKLYYVHVLKTYQKEEAQHWSQYLKMEKGISDAWVFIDDSPVETYSQQVANIGHRARYQAIDKALLAYRPPAISPAPVIASSGPAAKFLSYGYGTQVSADLDIRKELAAPKAEATAVAGTALSWTHMSGVGYIRGARNLPQAENREAGGAGVFTFVVEDAEGREIPAEVMLVDFEKLKMIASFNTGEHVAIRGTRREQMVTLVCEPLGYAQETRVYNIDHLSRGRDIVRKDNGVWEVRFRLRKMEVNDVAFLHATTFYKDAAILRRTSEAELANLVAVMQDNPGYKIVVHSYCDAEGKRVASVSENPSAFFDLSGSVSKTVSDKRLTKERARAIRNYLVAHGISKKRVNTIGWGSIEQSLVGDGKERGIEVELVEDTTRSVTTNQK